VLDLWFPDNGHWRDIDSHRAFWTDRMQGGMDAAICRGFGPLTEAAARGQLDDWAKTSRGRLALLIALDQFPRSLWRDTPAAFAQDMKACRLVLEALENGHYAALPHSWERQFHVIALSHCEGPDHLARMDLVMQLSRDQAAALEPGLEPMADIMLGQAEWVREVIRRFGRHPHRNPILGRLSSPDEEAYIAEGDFPHLRAPDTSPAG
jgi:uncharacterized protein (DUF924 family)